MVRKLQLVLENEAALTLAVIFNDAPGYMRSCYHVQSHT